MAIGREISRKNLSLQAGLRKFGYTSPAANQRNQWNQLGLDRRPSNGECALRQVRVRHHDMCVRGLDLDRCRVHGHDFSRYLWAFDTVARPDESP